MTDKTTRQIDLDYNRAVKAENRKTAAQEQAERARQFRLAADAFDIDEDRFGPQDS